MQKEYVIELNGSDRPNRFQVNPVKTSNTKVTTDDDGEAFEEDTFNDDIVLRNNRRSSR